MVKSQFRDVPLIEDESLPHRVLREAERYGNKPAIVDAATGVQWTFRELVTSARSLCAALAHRGMGRGDVACMFATNIVEYPICFHGIMLTGATVATANPSFTVNELLRQLNDCQASYIFTVPEVLHTFTKALRKCDTVKAVYVVGQVPGYISFQDLLQEGSTLPFPANVKCYPKEDVALIAYSSGTTGLPKGVMLTHFGWNVWISQWRSPELGLYKSPVTALGFLPFFHIYGIGVFLSANVVTGSTSVVMRRFNLQQYLYNIKQYKVTDLHIVPPVAVLLAKSPLVAQYDLSSVKNICCGAAPLSVEIAKLLHERFPPVRAIKQGYGLTEGFSHMGVDTEPYGNCGRIMPNTEVKVIDTVTGQELGVGQAGELLIRGPQLMKGYLNNQRATAETIDKEGWLHTGDLGKYDKEGNFFIVDRIKELIKYNGFQVPPAELEAVLLSHPDVADAAVVGLKDPTAGELPLAFVIRKPESTISEEGIRKFVDENVSGYKRLRGGVRFVKEIPKTPSGKILRKNLRDMVHKSIKSNM